MRKYRILLFRSRGSLFPYLIEKLSPIYDLYLVDSNPFIKKFYEDLNFFVVPLVTDHFYEVEITKLIKSMQKLIII